LNLKGGVLDKRDLRDIQGRNLPFVSLLVVVMPSSSVVVSVVLLSVDPVTSEHESKLHFVCDFTMRGMANTTLTSANVHFCCQHHALIQSVD
jgi:hypothetical protein